MNPRRRRWLLRLGLLVATTTLVIILTAIWSRPRAHIFDHQVIQVDGAARHYRLVIPTSLPKSARPLLIAFHGAGGSAEGLARNSGLDRLAVAKQFYLVYPEGRHASWPPLIPPENPSVIDPDLAFFDALNDELTNKYAIDPKRIYLTGMSQGAAFVNLLVAKRGDRIAAAAPHSGWLPKPLPDEGIAAPRPTPMLIIVGSEDRQVPPHVVQLSADCFADEGHPVTQFRAGGVGHQWASTQGINERIWDFLARHRLP